MTPGDIDSWTKIPAVPINAFKEVPICTFPPEQASKVFLSSGTTDPDKRSKVYMDQVGLEILDASFLHSTQTYTYPRGEKLHALLATPPQGLMPYNSILLYGQEKVVANHCIGEPEYFINEKGFNMEGLLAGFKKAEETGEPIVVIGATFTHVHFFDF